MSSTDPRPALREAAERVLAEHGLVLEDMVTRNRADGPEIRLVVDLPEDRLGSVDLDTVSAASSALNELVDADESLLGPDPAVLEVTTPGLDRPLTAARHFRRARGRLVSLELADGTRERARVLAVDGQDVVHLRAEPGRDEKGRPVRRPKGAPEALAVPVAEIAAARIEIEFDPPADLEQLLEDAAATVKES